MRYRDYIHEGKERLYKAGQGEQAAQLFMVELCRQKGINLYMDMDEEIDDEIRVDYLEGIHDMEKGKPLSYVLAVSYTHLDVYKRQGYDYFDNRLCDDRF